jgi:hypothetical protein
MKRALITGITGQDGLYLAELLLGKGYEVYGWSAGQNNPKLPLLQELLPDVKVLTGDLLDLSSLMRALNSSQPGEVYNLGAISFVAYSWENAHLTTDVTAKGVLNMLEATRLLRRRGPEPGALLPGVQLGDVRQGAAGPADRGDAALAAVAVRRGQGLRPLHDDQLPRVVRHARQLGILFNHESPVAGRSSSPARSPGPSRGSRSGCRSRSRWATSTRSATGASPVTTSRRCG